MHAYICLPYLNAKALLKKRLLLVGWDAADWKIINPLIKQGKMPALASLLANSSWGNLVTLDPPISPMLWTSIATGKRPYKHGIHGFTEATQDGKSARPVRVTSRTSQAIWNILNQNDLKTNVIGWWPSHPAEEINGVAISNFFGVDIQGDSHEFLKDSIHPRELLDELRECIVKPDELTSEMLLPFFPDVDELLSANDAVLRSVMRILAQSASIHAAATFAMENADWEFTAVYYDAIDHLCHLGMRYHPPQMEHVPDEDFKKYHYIVEAGYRFHDMMLERLLKLAGEDCAVILVSDHGFESGNKRILALPEEPGAPALEHNPYGVFLAVGKGFKKGQVYGASLLDVMPTILQYFDLPQAQDLDGKILPVFENHSILKPIVTYETKGLKKPSLSTENQVDKALISQLEELGYIQKNQEGNVSFYLAENEYYLARSLADGGMIEKALGAMEKLREAFPDVERYAQFYTSLLLRSGQYEALHKMVETWPDSAFTNYMKGLIYLQQSKPRLALDCFAAVNHQRNDDLLTKIALAWQQAGSSDQAEGFAKQAIEINPENIAAINLLGELALDAEDWELALTHFFTSLKLRYYQPKIHAHIGTCLYWLGYFADAAAALKIALQFRPGLLGAEELLREILLNELQKPEEWEAFNQSAYREPIVVVTGHPRSGTSMMMQMLHAGGIPVLTDQVREADQSNPKGYFELEAVKNIASNQDFLHNANGKAVKIVMPLLRLMQPHFPLKVIWMQRDVLEILKSQEQMKGGDSKNVPFELAQQMQLEDQRMTNWLNRYPHISYIQVKYSSVIENPFQIASQIKSFIGKDFNVQ